MKHLFTFQRVVNSFAGLLFMFVSLSALAEGTKQIRPAEGDNGYLVIDNAWSKFALYGCPETSRLNISICNAGEKIYYGFRQTSNNVEYRIKDENGVVHVGPAILPSSGAGRIGSHSQAVAGPQQIVGGSGYNALEFIPPTTGTYYIEFKNPGSRRTFDLFDITVASAANTAINGRVWSQAWMFSTNSYTNRFKGQLFIYSDDMIVTKLDFNGMQPYVFVVSANSTGTQDSGDPIEDRKSRGGLSTYPQYKIFLNDPDINCFPTGAFGSLTGPITITGCGQDRMINIPVDMAGNILVLLDLNGTPGYQPGTADRQFAATVVPGINSIPWDTKDGQGNTVPGGTSIDMQIDYLNGVTHLPLYDVEYHTNGYIVSEVRPTQAVPTAPQLFWDDTNIPNGTSNFTGCTSPCHTWSWNAQQQDNSSTDYGNRNTINTWWYGNIIKTNVQYDVDLVVVDANRLNAPGAANDTTVCTNGGDINIHPSITGFTTTGEWSTLTGGTLNQSSSTLDGTYTLSATEKTNGLAKLVLTSTNNGSCPASTDTLTINIIQGPTIDAGPPQSVCKSNPQVTLAGVAGGNTSTAEWSGAGTFVTGKTQLNAVHTPTVAQKNAGSATLTLTSTNNGICPAATDQVIITYTNSPTAEAGSNQTKCKNNAVITLAGTITDAEAGTTNIWSGGNGGIFAAINDLNTTYTPSTADLNAGSVTLTLTTNTAGCTSHSDNVTITFTASPTADAGNTQFVCSNNPEVTLDGSVTIATNGTWSAVGGGGNFVPNTLKGKFNPSAAQITAGSVKLVLTTTTGNGTCNAVTDTMTVNFTASPVANAGNDTVVCANNSEVSLNGASSTGKGIWSGGCGTYVVNQNTLSIKYTPCALEQSAFVAELYLSTDDNGNCNADQDTMRILMLPAPTADAGAPQTVCANDSVVTLSGNASGDSFTWSGGLGAFGDITSASTTYAPTQAEVNAGTVTLTLTANDIGLNCNPVTSDVTITIEASPTASAGADRSVCENNPDVVLNGSVTGATSQTWLGGGGTFSPNRNTLNATYTPLAGETNVTLTLQAERAGCNSVSESMDITVTPAPSVDAGSPQSVCDNNSKVTLAGVATEGKWIGGNGTFNPNRETLTAVYEPTPAEIASNSVVLTLETTNNGNCNAESDQVTISFTDAPVATAGANQTVCAASPAITLNGSVTIASGGIWSGGSGTYSTNNTDLSAQYTASDAEVLAGSVTLTLTSTGNNNCNADSSKMTITFSPAPTVEAGQSQTVCGNAATVNLDGERTVATGSTWSLGENASGSFSNASALKPVYNVTAADRTAGLIKLVITTNGSGVCPEVKDTMSIEFTTVPSITAGPAQTVCTNEYPILLNATGSPSTWSGGAGTFSDVNDLNSTYIPSAGEEVAGTVTLTITTNAVGACPSISEDVTITILPKPAPNTGGDQTICGSAAASIALNGAIGGTATGGFWTTDGDGHFTPDAATLAASYVPTATEIASGATIIHTLTSTPNAPCPAEDAQMTLTITPEIVVNAGPPQTVCADVTSLTMQGTVLSAGGGTWSKVSAAGTIADATNLSTTYTIDPADITATTVTLRLTSTGNGTCPAVEDDVTFTITPSPTADAGAPQTICADAGSINLTGIPGGPATDGKWTTPDGKGTFSPSAFISNTSYFPSEEDTLAGQVTFIYETTTGNGTCNPITDQIILTIDPVPVVYAGEDTAICEDATSITLDGAVYHATGGTWTTSGNGTFDNDQSLNAVYTFDPADITDGTVTLTLESDGNGTCNPVSDQIIISFTPAPTVDAGPPQTVCSDVANIQLDGKITEATGAVWSGGNGGTFSDPASLTATYTPTTADTAAGFVTLTLTTTGNGTCNSYQDDVTITFKKKPIVNAGLPATVCADSAYVDLNGQVFNALSGIWTRTGTGNFSLNNTQLNGKYVFSPADKLSGSVTLTLTSDGNGSCAAVSADKVITITSAPTVTVGPDQEICADSSSIDISGTLTVATIGKWTSSGNGTFGNINGLTTTYSPSANDISAGGVNLTLTSVDNGTCKSVSKSLHLTIAPIPTANPGSDKTICADIESISLNGLVTGATGGTWSTLNGTGGFDPDVNTLNADYHITEDDRTLGEITLTLTTSGNGMCKAVSEDLVLKIDPAPTAEAGAPQTICADASGVNLNGSVTVTTTGEWSSATGGNFSPSASALNAKYIPSATDKTNGSVKLFLTTTGNGTCNAVSDSVLITITPIPVVDAGTDITVCSDIEFVQLDGTISHATGGRWATDGSGSFSPDSSAIDAVYSPSPDDRSGGSVTLTLISTGMGTCNAVSKNITLTLTPLPTVDAGPAVTSCIGAGAVALNPTLTTATAGFWTTTNGLGTFSPDENTVNASYVPDPSEEVAGNTITVFFTTIDNGACDVQTDTLEISFSPAPAISAGPDKEVCETDLPVQLEGSGTNGTWSGGTGTFSPNANTLNAKYIPDPSEIGTIVTLTLTRSAAGGCPAGSEDVDITIKTGGPTVDAGAPITACTNSTNIPLAGLINGDVTGVLWTTGSGTGTFSNINDVNATFTPSPSQITAGVANLTLTSTGSVLGCKSQSDKVVITLGPSPTIDPGFDQNVCANVSTINLSATKTVASGVLWSKVSGTGTFDSDISETPVYTRTAADTIAGSVTLRVKTTGNGTHCKADSADVIISFKGSPRAIAGASTSHCADVSEVQLSGTVEGATGGLWTTSSVTGGSFSPNASTLNAKYIPSATDKTGNVTLTLTTTGTGSCAPAATNRVLTFTTPPAVSAGVPQSFCSDKLTTPLTGSFSGAAGVGVLWTSTGTGNFDNDTDPATEYEPSAQDKANGGVNLTLTTTGSAPCAEVQSFVTLTILPAPTSSVNAGFDQEVCKDAAEVQLQGIVTIAGGGKWSKVSASAGGSFFPNDSTLDAKYIPSSADTAAGSVTLRLTTTGNGICDPAFDETIITFTQTPKVTIAAIPTICTDVESIQLNGAVTVATGGKWTTSGSGKFSPNEFTLNAKYFPSEADFTNGSVGLTLTSTGNGTCNPGTNSSVVTFQKKPTVFAGTDKKVCADATDIHISGSITSASLSTWTSSGTGGSFDNDASLNTIYHPSASDIASTKVILTLTTSGPGSCNPVEDKIIIDFTPAPTVSISPAQTICADATGISLNGKVTVATGGLWTTSGKGTFSPNSNTLNATYNPSEDDKAANTVTLTLTTTGNGTCKAVDSSQVITILDKPQVSSGPAVSCAYLDGAPLNGVLLNPSGNPGQGLWSSSGSGVFSASNAVPTATYFPSAADITAGSVILTLTSTDNAMCNPVSASSTVLVGPLPIAEAGGDQFVCTNSSISLVAQPSANVDYAWTDNLNNPIGNTESVNVTVPANTFVVLTVTDARGCDSKDTVRLKTYDLPTLSLPAHACLSDTLVLDANPTNMPVVPGEFQWLRAGSMLPGENDFTLVVKNAGLHVIRWSYGTGSCNVTDTTNVTAPPVLKTVDTIVACVNETALLNTISTPATGLTYAWSNGALTQSAAETPVLAGINTYYITATDALGCTAMDSIKLNGIPVPQFSIKDSTVCQDQTIVLDATLTDPALMLLKPTYQWKRDNVLISHTDSTLSVTTANVSSTTPSVTEYIVIATIDQCAGKDTADITFNPVPTDVLAADTRFCIDTDKQIILNAGAGAGYTYEWKDDLGNIIGVSQTDTVFTAGLFFVSINNTFNCPLNDSVLVKDICKPRVFIPTGFSPNGKGNAQNETLQIFGSYFGNFKLTIFNRWGEIIFYTEDPAVSWDGTYRGEPMPVGVYPYLVTYDGLEEEFKGPYKDEGSITIVR